MNKHQKRIIDAALSYPRTWHIYARDTETVTALCATCNLGIIKINELGQFSLKSENAAKQFLNARMPKAI